MKIVNDAHLKAMTPKLVGALIVFILFIIGGGFAAMTLFRYMSASPDDSSPGGESVGLQSTSSTCSGRCVVRVPSPQGTHVVLAVSKQALNEMLTAGSGKAMAVMVLNGSAFLVPQNTPVSIVERAFGARKVLVLQGPTLGRTGWVPTEWVVDQY